MEIIHFNVDAELDKYLSGEKYSYSLEQITGENKFADTEAISINVLSAANKETLAVFPKLKLLLTCSVGTDHIDLDYCKEKGIAVYHIVDYGAFNIAEHVFALLLAGTRNIIHSQKEIKNGVFSYKNHLGIALKGKRIGVVGTGHIGHEVIKLAKGFEMEVVAFDVAKNEKAKDLGFEYVPLEELAKTSDIITLHLSLHDGTKHIINDKMMNGMKNGVILINTARGGLVDTNALIDHIKKFRWVGLDVLEDEDSFSTNHPLLQYSNVIITPHIAFFSDASVKKIAEETVRLMKNFLEDNKEGRVV